MLPCSSEPDHHERLKMRSAGFKCSSALPKRIWLWALASILLVAPAVVDTKASGAPKGTCESMFPFHNGAKAQTGPSHFMVTVSHKVVAPGESVNITIASSAGFIFLGFLLQVRTVKTQDPIGKFTHFDSDTQTMDCSGGFQNSVTHRNGFKKPSVVVTWQSPDDFSGSVTAIATVVEEFSKFWVNVSQTFQVRTGSSGISTTQIPHITPITSTTSEFVTLPPITSPHLRIEPIYEGCGVEKACLGDVSDCDKSGTCKAIVTILVKGDIYEFEMKTQKGEYIAVGLSDDSKMGDDSVVECIHNTSINSVQIYQSWNNKDYSNSRLPSKDGIEMKNASYEDGAIYCKFTRDKVTNVSGRIYNLDDQKYYLLLASGSSVTGEGIEVHNLKVASGKSGYLSDVNAFSAKSQILLRLHGAFMVGSWIGAASIGIVLARYFRQTWAGTQCCGKDLWFAWHRMLMVLVWCLTIAAFVMIFVEIQGWTAEDNTHAILGVITTILAFFQPIAAIFRPSPDARRRPIFNWIHWLVGNCAHILAIVTIFFADKLQKALLPNWWIWMIVGYVAFHILMHLMFSVAGCVSEQQSSRRINSFPMKEMSNSRVPLASAERRQEAPYSCFRKFLLAVYIIGILIFTIAIIIIIVEAPVEQSYKRLFSGN